MSAPFWNRDAYGKPMSKDGMLPVLPFILAIAYFGFIELLCWAINNGWVSTGY
jgi:hypothetical protein